MRALALALAALAGCGYQAGLLVPERAHTVGIQVFDNVTLLRNLEVEVTDGLARSVASLVPLALVPPDRADVVIRGTVAEYRRRSGVRDGENLPLETGVSLTVTAELVRRSTGEVLSTSVAALSSGFVVEGGIIADDTRNEVAARARAVDNVTDGIVLDLFSHAREVAGRAGEPPAGPESPGR